MSGEEWITLAALVAMVALLVSNRVSPTLGVLGTTGFLYVVGTIDSAEAFSGFSNLAPITVAGLYVVAEGIAKTGALEPFVRVALSDRAGPRTSLGRLVVPSAAASSVMANTPIVAMLVPEVLRWSSARKKPASRLLLPLSYASILGGTLTLIGTSTNLVVSGLLAETGAEPLGFFEFTPFALPIVLVGMLVIVLLAPIVIPDRRGPEAVTDGETERAFSVSMRVVPAGPLDGATVLEAGLRHLDGVFLVELRRGDRLIAPVAPDQALRAGDELVFVGRSDQAVDLHAKRGLESVVGDPLAYIPKDDPHRFFEAVIGASSPLVGQTLADVEFRARYQAAVVGLHRAGEQVRAKLGEVPLVAGDTLLLLGGRDFRARWRDRGDFLLVSELDGPDLRASRKAPIAAVALALVTALPLLGAMSVTRATLLACAVLVLGGVLRPWEAREAVNLNVVLMIAGSFGLGAAVQGSGLGATISEGILAATTWAGDFGTIVGLLLAAMVLTELVTNAAAAALIFPTALAIAGDLGYDPRIVLIGVAVVSSASFLTPIGYQTNTMVYGPGGYKFTDYLRLGIPLALVSLIGGTTMVLLLG